MCVNPNGHSYIPVETRTVDEDSTDFTKTCITYVDELMCIYCRDFQRINRKTTVGEHPMTSKNIEPPLGANP